MDSQKRTSVGASPRQELRADDLPAARLRGLVEGLDGIVWEMDAASGRFTYVSPQAERIVGYPPERWYDDPGFWTERLVHPADRESAASQRASAAAECRDHQLEYRAVGAQGRTVWLNDVARVESGPDGRPRLLRGVMVDVTGPKEAERGREEQVRHAALSAAVSAALAEGGSVDALLQRCAAAVVQHLGAAFARVWLLNPSEPVLDLRASAGLYTHLNGAHGRVPVGSFKIGLIAEERTPHLTNDVQNDPRVSDKEWARREGMVAFAGYPLLAEGRLMGVMAMFARHRLGESALEALRTVADRIAVVIERKRAEAVLHERDLQFAEAQRIARLGSWEWDVSSARMGWSDELYRIFGLLPQSEECTMDSYLARVHPDDRERVAGTLREARRTGRSFEFEERIVRPDGGERVLLSRGRAVADDSGQVTRLMGTCQDVTEQREAVAHDLALAREQAARLRAEEERERTAFLSEAGRVLSSSLDYHTTLNNFAHLAVPRIADWCAIDVLDEEGEARRVVIAHPDPAKEELAREMERRYPSDPEAPTGVPEVLRTGKPELVTDIPPELLEAAAVDEEHRRIIRALRLRSYMVLPLVGRGRILGAITFVAAESGRRYDEEDLRFAQELASRAALAVDNAGLYRLAEEAREQNTRILTSITDAFFSLDDGWRFRFVNPEAERVLHRRADELLGRNLWEAFPEAVGSTFEKAYRQAVGTQQTVDFEEYFPPLGTWFEVRAYPSSDGLSVFFRDVNERHRAQEELKRSEEHFRYMTNAVPVQIWTARPDGGLVFVSDRTAEYFGVTPEELIGQGWLEVVHPDDRGAVVERWTASLRTGDPYEVQFRLRSLSGEFRWFLGRADAQKNAAGAVMHWFGSNTEIQQQKEAEAERERLIGALNTERRRLEVSNRELDQFAYVASHDLKAPLRGIANLSQWIEEDLAGEMNAEVREHLELLRGRVHRMEGLIDGVLQYSRAGRAREKPEPVDVGALVEEVADLIALPDGFELEVAGELPTLVAERLPLQQVFMNLIGNAAKYSRREDGRAEVRADPEGAFHHFRVSDNGPGIAPEYHERIFGIFQTLEARDKIEGTGIGLSLVKKIVEARGGRVWIESEEGEGASFHFLWPTETKLP